jgi:hypothetical protein
MIIVIKAMPKKKNKKKAGQGVRILWHHKIDFRKTTEAGALFRFLDEMLSFAHCVGSAGCKREAIASTKGQEAR